MTTILLPWPPSVNAMYRVFRNRSIMSKVGREYVKAVQAIVHERGEPTLHGPLQLTIFLARPDKRRRDIDNLCKSLLDSLTKAGFWDDDSQIQRLDLRWDGYHPDGLVTVTAEASPLL